MEKEIFEVALEDIIPNRFQPREKFDEEALKDLSDSIKQYGLIQPIVVRRLGDKYEIIAGERRYKASTLAGLQKIPVVIKNLGDTESAEVALVENIQRQGLTPIEEARSYDKLLALSGDTQETLAKKLGVAQPTVANKIRLLNLSSAVQEALLNKQISERHARALLKLKEKPRQDEMLKKIIETRMTVRQLDEALFQKNEQNITPIETNLLPKKEATSVIETPKVNDITFLDTKLPSEEIKENNYPKEVLTELPEQVETVENISIPEIELNPIPEIMDEKPLREEPQVEKEPILLPKIEEVNIEQEKEAAKDINEGIKKPNFDMLLKADPVAEDVNPVQELPEILPEPPAVEPTTQFISKEQSNDIISSTILENADSANKEELFIPNLKVEAENNSENREEKETIEQLPETNVNSLIQEYKQEKGMAGPEIPAVEAIPKLPTLPIKESIPVQAEQLSEVKSSPPESPGQTFVTGNLRTAINTVRQCIGTVEKYGFRVDSEEFDFEDMYQIIIKIEKNKSETANT